MPRSHFDVKTNVGVANSIRRTILSDISSWAPYEVEFRRNTSCHTDEYIAHRIGLIPFRKRGEGESMTLTKVGGMVYAEDFVGRSFEPLLGRVPLLDLAGDHALDLTVRFDERPASSHARYATCSAVGMAQLEESRYRISFEALEGADPAVDLFLSAIERLEERVDRALLQLAAQPDPPPKSRTG